MKADLTRDTFRAEQRFARLIHPQGHVTLDAELNEQAQIQLHRDRTTAVDVIGHAGTPNGSGFQLVASPNKLDLLILPGDYYAEGRAVEAVSSVAVIAGFPAASIVKLDALTLDGRALSAGEWIEIAAPGANTHRFQITAIDAANRQLTVGANDIGPTPDTSPLGKPGATVRRIPSYVFQPDWPRPSDTAWPAAPALPSLTLASGTYGAFLEVFAHHVADLSDPLLREVALGGIDGASREQTAWQVRLRKLGPAGTDATCAQVLPPPPARRGTLAARAKKPATGTNPCIIDPAAQYRRLENQLYRIEIHKGGTLGVDPITFKFSRENGSVVVRWTGSTTTSLTVASTGRDDRLGLAAGDWIELIDDQCELARTPGSLVQIDTIDGTTINLKSGTAVGSTAIADFPFHPRIRRWDHVGAAALAVARPATNDGYLALEDGVEVRFDDGTYETGDYWIVPARTILGDVEWPRDLDGLPIAQPSRGGAPIRVALAVVSWDGSTMSVLHDCRTQFPPLTHICAKDVCLDNNPCDRGWTTVQQAIEDLCHEDDLVHHNRHLHGWGVVCGLQVNCMLDDYAKQHQLARPREWIIVRDGYAIHPTGSDIIIESAAHDQITAIELADLVVAAGIAQRNPTTGALPDTSVSLWVDKDRSFHVEAFDPSKQKKGWQQLLDGTILSDIYNDCILKVIDFFRSQLTPGAGEGLVGPTAKRIIALLNLLWQLINQTNGSHIYLSGEPNPTTEPVDKEDAILRALFDGLRQLLQSKCFCAMFDDLSYPSYDVYRSDLPANAPHPTTIFGTGTHTRIRVHPRRPLAFTCGNGGTINVYDLTAQKLSAAVDFPIGGAEVQDVAFGPIGNEIYAIAWIGDAQVDSVFVVGTINADNTITWTGNQVQCHLKLVTLATSDLVPGVVYAAARGLGVYPFNPGALTPTPTAIKSFHATGHLVAASVNGKAMLYAGSHTTDTNPVAFNEVLGIDIKAPTSAIKFALPVNSATGGQGIGHDDLAVALSTKNGVASLYAIIDDQSATKRLVAWDLADPLQTSAAGAAAKQVTALGQSAGGRVAYSAAGNWSMVTYEDHYLGKAYRPGQTALEEGIHPLQIGPVSIATDADGRTFYVLELISHTITVVPAVPTPQSPWISTIDVAKLQQYRWAAIVVFVKMLGRFVQFLKDCICDHLLVNCQDPTGKKVYLADIAFKDGKVYQICNFHHRRYVHTFPTIEYWLSFVPILPAIKLAVEKLCCSVLAGVFDRFAPPQNVAAAKADRVSVTMLHHGLTFAKDLRIGSQIQAKRSQLISTALLGRLALGDVLARPAPGNMSAAITSGDLVNRNADAATAAAKDKGVVVRNVQVASALDASVRSVFSAPKIQPGDTVDLLTDKTGRVIGTVKVSPTDTARPGAGAPAAAPAAASADDTAALRRELTAMKALNDQHATLITGLQNQLAEMNKTIARLQPK